MGIGYRNREQYADPTPYFAVRSLEEKQARRAKPTVGSPVQQATGPETAHTPDEQLCIAIICQAAEDYRAARRVLRRYPGDREAQKLLRDAEEFFNGDWIRMLTNVPGPRILARLAAEFDNEKGGAGSRTPAGPGSGGSRLLLTDGRQPPEENDKGGKNAA